MKKALLLTNCELTSSEIEMINNASIFKLAINTAPFGANYRIFHDSHYYKIYCENYQEKLITHNCHKAEIERSGLTDRFHFIYDTTSNPVCKCKDKLFVLSGTMTPAIDFLLKNNFNEILLIATNTKYYKSFQDEINIAIKKMLFQVNNYDLSKYHIYKFKQNANFSLEYKSLEQFLNE